MPSNDQKPPWKELKDIPAECDALYKDLFALNFDSIATRFIGILRVTASRVLEALDGYGKRLDNLEAFRDEAMRAYLEAQAAAEKAATTPPVDGAAVATAPSAETPPKVKTKKNGHAKGGGLKVVPPTEPAPTAATPEAKP